MKKRRLAVSACLALIASSSQAVFLVNDTFTDSVRIGAVSGASTTSSSPTVVAATSTNTQWIANVVSQLVASPTGQLWTMSSTSRIAAGYFPDVTLASGTATTFTLNFRTGAEGATTNNLRVSLTNGTPSGTRQTDGVGSTDATYVNDEGYGIFTSTNVGGGSTVTLGLSLRERATISSNNILGTLAEWTSLASDTATSGYMQPNTDYSVVLTIAFDGTKNSFTGGIVGGNLDGLNLIGEDSASPVTTFNQINFRLGGGSNQWSTINFTSFTVEQVAIPEPSTWALGVATAALGLAWMRRRRA